MIICKLYTEFKATFPSSNILSPQFHLLSKLAESLHNTQLYADRSSLYYNAMGLIKKEERVQPWIVWGHPSGQHKALQLRL